MIFVMDEVRTLAGRGVPVSGADTADAVSGHRSNQPRPTEARLNLRFSAFPGDSPRTTSRLP